MPTMIWWEDDWCGFYVLSIFIFYFFNFFGGELI
jgi:hypothetical protein